MEGSKFEPWWLLKLMIVSNIQKDRMSTDWKKLRRMVLKKLFLVRSANDVLNNSSNNICWLIFDPPKIIFLLWRQKSLKLQEVDAGVGGNQLDGS